MFAGGTKVASFTIYEDANYRYLVTKYALSDALYFSGGHHTVISTHALGDMTAHSAEVVMQSRVGNEVKTTVSF
jgi:hypothetical protein